MLANCDARDAGQGHTRPIIILVARKDSRNLVPKCELFPADNQSGISAKMRNLWLVKGWG